MDDSKPKTDECISTTAAKRLHQDHREPYRNHAELHKLWSKVTRHYNLISVVCLHYWSSYYKDKKEITVTTGSQRQESFLWVCFNDILES